MIGRIVILLRDEKSRLAWPQIFLRWLCISLISLVAEASYRVVFASHF